MTKRFLMALAALALVIGMASAQNTKTVLQNATEAMGDVKSIQFSGTGHYFTLGQNFNSSAAWPDSVLSSYSRTIDYSARSSKEELTRTDTNPPAIGGGARFSGEQKQVNLVSGSYAWNQPGNAPQPAMAAADERQLQIWLTPHGFLKAAMENNATTKSAKSGTMVSFMAMGKFKVNGTIDNQNMVTRVETWIPNPVLGDMPVETKYSNYKDFGGVKFPTSIVQEQGGHPVLDLTVTSVRPNAANDLPVPDAVKQATPPPVVVKSQKMADGVWFLGGGTHNSVLIEYPSYLVMVEAPLNEERSLALIAETKKLVPNKPIKYLVNTHHHFDHSGGVRTYVEEGAIVITNAMNKSFYEGAWKAPRTLAPDKLSQNPKKPEFVTVKDKYVLTEGARTLEILHLQGETHNEGMMIAYLPKEKILIEADDYTPSAPNAPPPPINVSRSQNLYDNIQRLKLDVDAIAPLHGEVSNLAALMKVTGKS